MKGILVCLVCSGLSVAQAASVYRVSSVSVTELPTLGGTQSAALDINNAGHVVGWSLNAAGVRRAFVQRGGVLVDLTAAFGAYPSEASGINDRGDIVGTWQVGSHPHAFRHSPGGLVRLAEQTTRFPTGSSALKIAANGHIAGHAKLFESTTDVYMNAALWLDEYSYTSLAYPWYGAWTSWATDVSLVGTATVVIGYHSAVNSSFRWRIENAAITRHDVIPLVPGGSDFYYTMGEPKALNGWGQVVGYVTRVDSGVAERRRRAFLWSGTSGGVPSEIGVFPTGTQSVAEDINNSMFVVGYADEIVYLPVTFTRVRRNRPFLYHSDFGLYALPLPVTVVLNSGHCVASALNQRSLTTGRFSIVGTCDYPSGPRAVRWDVTVERITTAP
jgi:probable HAF family extracellular repeat protein